MIPLNDDEKLAALAAIFLGVVIGTVGELYGWSFYKAFVLTSAVAAAAAAIAAGRV